MSEGRTAAKPTIRLTRAQIKAASEQLDWAIRLLIDHKSFVAALTLAGAAEGMVAPALGERTLFSTVRKISASKARVSEKHLGDYLNNPQLVKARGGPEAFGSVAQECRGMGSAAHHSRPWEHAACEDQIERRMQAVYCLVRR
jgi:hypothetical protein